VYRDFKVVPHTVVSDKSAFCRADAQAGDLGRVDVAAGGRIPLPQGHSSFLLRLQLTQEAHLP
jgi:hypothetical protein